MIENEIYYEPTCTVDVSVLTCVEHKMTAVSIAGLCIGHKCSGEWERANVVAVPLVKLDEALTKWAIQKFPAIVHFQDRYCTKNRTFEGNYTFERSEVTCPRCIRAIGLLEQAGKCIHCEGHRTRGRANYPCSDCNGTGRNSPN
jgi:hypothetical protein